MGKNAVRDIFVARIKQLMSQYEESQAITHPSTVGAMREQFLKNFLSELLPPKFSPVSGFITDMYGNITPQLDMIFIDRSELPAVSLVGDAVVVPWEIALLIVEVKSTLTGQDLEQIKEQQEAIDRMRSEFLMAADGPEDVEQRTRRNRIGIFLIAFESKVAEARLEKWVKEEMEEPAGICVLKSNGGILSVYTQVMGGNYEVVKSTEPNDYAPLLTFVGAIYRCLYLLLLYNSAISDQELRRRRNSHAMFFWEGYLSRHLYDYAQRFR